MEVDHIGIEDGLLHREVNAIYQDSRGLVWMATPLGINRYDGYRIKWYTPKTHGFSIKDFGLIKEDQQGRLWFFGWGPLGGKDNFQNIEILDPVTEQVQSFDSLFSEEAPFAPKDLRSMCVTGPEGGFFFQGLDDRTIFRYSREKGFQTLPPAPWPDFEVRLVSPRGTLWGKVGPATLGEIDQQGKPLRLIERPVASHNYLTTTIYPEVSDQGFYFQSHSLPSIHTHFCDWDGEVTHIPDSLWSNQAAFLPKLHFFAAILHKTDKILPDPVLVKQLQAYFGLSEGTYFRSFYLGKDGAIWASGNFGAYQLRLRRDPFTRFFALPYEDKIRSRYIAGRGMVSRGNYLYANLEPQRLAKIEVSSGASQLIQKTFCGYHYRLAMASYFDSSLVIGDDRCLLFIGDDFEVKKSWVTGNKGKVWAIYPERPDRLWLGLGSEEGLAWANPLTETIRLGNSDSLLRPLAGKVTYHIAPDKDGNLWLCTSKGMFRFDNKDSSFVHYGSSEQGARFLPASNFLHYYQDANGIFWLATRGEGLVRWDPATDSTTTYSRETGLANNTIYAVYEDAHQHLWLPSDYGIIQFNKATGKSRTYLPQDGTSEVEFNRISHTQDSSGRLFFGSINGITSFHPDDFYADTSFIRPPLHLSGIWQFNADQNRLVEKTLDFKQGNPIEMAAADRYLQVKLALLNYENLDINQYLWKIDGLNESWQVQNAPELQLSRLPYGAYTLRIKARTGKGQESANELVIALKVIPPFYLQPSFIILMVLGILFIIGLLVYLRFRQLKNTQALLEYKVAEATEELREMDRLKARLFANVSHELRTPLSLILGPISSVLKNYSLDERVVNYLELARQNGRSLQRLITEIMDLGKLDNGKLTVNETSVDFSAFLQKVRASFASLAEVKGLHFRYQSELAEEEKMSCDLGKVEKIINNLLSNAIKFTPEGGEVSLQIGRRWDGKEKGETGINRQTSPSQLEIRVSDSGSGIPEQELPYIFDRYYQVKQGSGEAQGGTGIGLALSKELAELMGGSLTVSSRIGEGSSFVFLLPWKTASQPIPATLPIDKPLPEPQPTLPVAEAAAGREHLLVAEDNPDLRHFLKTILSRHYQVITCRNGKEALGILKKLQNARVPSLAGMSEQAAEQPRKVDLLITDLMMPEMDGFALLENIRTDQELRYLPVVMLTARTGLSSRLKALRLGVHDYLTKPFEEEELLARIENLLTWARVREEENKSQGQGDGSGTEEPEHTAHEDWMQEVDDWLSAHFRETGLKIRDWADALNLSESQFRRKLKKACGLSPHQYLQEYRLNSARQLLEGQAFATVSEVAYEAGFSSADYFGKVFQKRFGKRPSDYLAA